MSKTLAVYMEGQEINVKLYDTVILKITGQGSVFLNMGGWHTQTTVKHLNKALSQNLIPLTVYTLAGRAMVLNTESGVKYPFNDGMRFDLSGVLLS